jgi:microcin C transport system permease protein
MDDRTAIQDRATIQVQPPSSTVSAPPPVDAPPPRKGWLSPINQRRWQNFKANRRGYISLWVFTILFLLSLCAEFIANDRPLMIRMEGRTYFPVFF